MPQSNFPFAVPRKLQPSLMRVFSYWEDLKRGGNQIPFCDDVRLTVLPDLADRIVLIDVFEAPERFRFGMVGAALAAGQQPAVAGRFLDETSLTSPLDYLRSQCSATVELGAPTYFQTAEPGSTGAQAGGRLVLPLWGEGKIRMLLVAVD
jgi:hypothetical protein